MNQIKVELQDVFGSDRAICESAWTSSLSYEKKKTRTEDDVKRLIAMLADNKHSTPFESVIFRFWMKIPIVTDRQIVTHRIGTHNGMSGRYRRMPNEYLELPEDIDEILRKLPDEDGALGSYYSICEKANNTYMYYMDMFKNAEAFGTITNSEYKRLREVYRGILPQCNMTERVTIFNLRSFANFYKLRSSEHAQPEIRKVAELMLEEVKKIEKIRISIEQLEKNGWNI